MLLAIGSLWVAFFAAVTLVSWFRIRSGPGWNWVAVFTLIVGLRVVLLFFAPFYGQEYEDAYEYVYAGMVFSSNPEAMLEGLNPLCGWGTIDDCDVMFTLSHPVGAGVFYSLIFRVIDNIAAVRLLSTALTGLIGLVAIYAASLTLSKRTAGPVVLLIAVVPLVGLYSITGFSEVLGATVLAGFLLAQVSVPDSENRRLQLLGFVLLFVSGALLGLIKRELFVVPVLAALVPICGIFRRRPGAHSLHLVALLMGAIATLLLSKGAVADISVARTSSLALFSADTFTNLAPAFLKIALTDLVFLPYGALLLCAVSLGWIAKETRWATAQASVLLVAGLAFSQSYYYALSGEVPVIHFERYSFVLWPLVVLILVGLSNRVGIAQRLAVSGPRTSTTLGVVLIIAVSAVFTGWIGNQRTREERASRFEPVEAALEILPPEGWLLTLDPIIVGLVDSETRTIDLPSLAAMIDVASFSQFVGQERVLLLLPIEGIDVEMNRYRQEFSLLRGVGVERVVSVRADLNGYSLFWLRPSSEGSRSIEIDPHADHAL